MVTRIVFTALVAAIAIAACAINAKAESAISYRDAVKACGIEWRASDARKNAAKGTGREAWNAYRAACVTRQGYVKKGETK